MSLSLMATQVTFTEVWTTHSKRFYVNPYWTVSQFLESMAPLIKYEFKTNDFEIVEKGQIIKGIPSEEAPAVTNSEIKIRVFKATGRAELQEFSVAKSKAIIDKIDLSLGSALGFSKETIDYLINYDIKFRGAGTEE